MYTKTRSIMDYNKSNKNRVELHIHFDGAFRPSTVLSVAKKREFQLKDPNSEPISFNNAEELADYVRIKTPGTLRQFLKHFPTFLEPFNDNEEGMAQVSREFVEDCAMNNICYVEARFCPNFFAGPSFSVDNVVKTVLDNFHSAGKEHNVKVGVILSAIRELPEFSPDIIRLAQQYSAHGVVGIDVAGDEQHSHESGQTHDSIVELFEEAEKSGIHRTVHAGENGPSESVKEALFSMHAERIGHGYHALDDPQIYQHMLHEGVHFELCPLSSRLTSSVNVDNWSLHPIHRLAADRANYSINTDDPICTGNWLNQEYVLCIKELGLPPWELVRANYSAARSCFLPAQEKIELLEHLDKAYAGKL